MHNFIQHRSDRNRFIQNRFVKHRFLFQFDFPNATITSTTRNENGNAKMNERCRFWPDCRNEDVCPFHHPSKPCTTFPNCWYGEKCLFIHPPCKFALNCSKPNCIYTHYKTSSNTAGIEQSTSVASTTQTDTIGTSSTTVTAATVTSATGISSVAPTIPISTTSTSTKALTSVACRFSGRCQNLKCPYKHPPLCRFGLNCLNKACYFLHRKAGGLTSLSKVYNVSASSNSAPQTTIS